MTTDTTKKLKELVADGMSTRDIQAHVNTTSAEQVRRWLRGEAQPSAERREIISKLWNEKIGDKNVANCPMATSISSRPRS